MRYWLQKRVIPEVQKDENTQVQRERDEVIAPLVALVDSWLSRAGI